MAGKIYKPRQPIKVNMKKQNPQKTKSPVKKDENLNGCPACYLITVSGEKHHVCRRCNHLFTGKMCDYCSAVSRSGIQ